MKIAVIGATGMVGSALTDELLQRGHHVTAVARHPEKLADRPGLTRAVADVMRMDELAAAIRDHDVVVSAYAPNPGVGPQAYKSLVEAGWRIKRTFKKVKGKYLINVGGASSLWTPNGTQQFEDPGWPKWFFNTASPEHLRYLRGMTGRDMFDRLAQAREQILATPGMDPYADWPDEEMRQFIQGVAEKHDKGEGGRAQLEMFSNDTTLRWSFVSPPWFMRPGPRIGTYRTTIDTLPLEGKIPAGISVADLALAIADEIENQRFIYKHWSVARIEQKG